MIKVVLKDGSSIDVPEGASIMVDTTGSDKDGTMSVRVTFPNVTGLLPIKPGEALDLSSTKKK